MEIQHGSVRYAYFIGDDGEHAEFAPAIEWLRSSGSLLTFPSASRAIDCDPVQEPELIVCGQSYRGQFSPNEIQRLESKFPLARVICLLGSWCEGETRSGSPVPGVERWYADQFVDRMVGEELGLGIAPQPATATNEERWLSIRSAPQPTDGQAKTIVVFSRDEQLAEAIATACRATGRRSLWTFPDVKFATADPCIMVYDADPDPGRRTAELRQIKRSWPASPVVALVDFPRAEEHRDVLGLGADAVMSKPFLLDDLLTRLHRLELEP
jgi:CheY-like chemotaxis protein